METFYSLQYPLRGTSTPSFPPALQETSIVFEQLASEHRYAYRCIWCMHCCVSYPLYFLRGGPRKKGQAGSHVASSATLECLKHVPALIDKPYRPRSVYVLMR